MATIDNHAPHKPRHVGDLDAMVWGIEKDPLFRQTITVVLILDRAPDREVLLDRLERGSRTLPSFRHRLVEAPLRLSTPRWLVDPNFDLSYHVAGSVRRVMDLWTACWNSRASGRCPASIGSVRCGPSPWSKASRAGRRR